MQGDSDRVPMGGGSGGSKSLMHSGTAIVEAAAKIVEKGKETASHVLEAAASDIEFPHGRFVIAGTDRSISVMELAQSLRERQRQAAGRMRRNRSTSTTSAMGPAPRPSPMAATLPKSRSIPRPAWSN